MKFTKGIKCISITWLILNCWERMIYFLNISWNIWTQIIKLIWVFKLLAFSIIIYKIFKYFLSFLIKLLRKDWLVKSVKLVMFNIYSANPMQRHSEIFEWFACIQRIFAIIFWLPVNLYYVSREIWLDNSKKLIFIDQSIFCIFPHQWELKNV